MRKTLFSSICFCCSAVMAEPLTGMAEVAKLTEMITTLNKQLTELKDMTDLQKQLSEMEQLDLVREVSATGEAMSDLANALQETSQLTQDIYGNIVGVNDQISTVLYDIETYAGGFSGYFNPQGSGFSRVDEVLADLNEISSHLGALDDQYWTGSPVFEVQPNTVPGVNEVVGRSNALADDLSTTTDLDNAIQQTTRKIVDEGMSADDAQRLSAEQLNLIALLLTRDAYRQIADDSARLNEQSDREKQRQDERDYFRSMYVNPYLIDGEGD
ncbi:hypothetical protein [Reinekea blandensis]|uniref:Uncharacterized protein n=1 Tax=Reinekea blandensis MED297 TaxID=314283 RepID=A4BJX5_9GAMM|nr:hypothetical protein [Reinekea blandensis]EAR07576.1 hypothetical protein MED297_00105 [Reinekea sp. MED297] [Reinekea blandensis MED297]